LALIHEFAIIFPQTFKSLELEEDKPRPFLFWNKPGQQLIDEPTHASRG
jgi:hypothetical protein